MNGAEMHFSRDQLGFLAVLEVFGVPISLEVAGALAPISPAEFLDLKRKAEKASIIKEVSPSIFAINQNLPPGLQSRLNQINTKKRLTDLFNIIEVKGMNAQVVKPGQANLLAKMGKIEASVRIDHQMALELLQAGDLKKAADTLGKALDKLETSLGGQEADELLIMITLLFSTLNFQQGKGWLDLPNLLDQALHTAQRLGDRRSWALLNMHLGRLHYFSVNRQRAIDTLSLGIDEANKLGDEDILAQAAEFTALFYYIQGRLRQASQYFESALQAVESQDQYHLFEPWAPVYFGFCLTYLGQFQHAIGCLDCYWRLAQERPNLYLATILQSVLGIALVITRKEKAALFHLRQAEKQALNSGNDLAFYYARMGLAYDLFFGGRIKEAHELLNRTLSEKAGSGIVTIYASPWFLDMLYRFEELGLKTITGFGFPGQLERSLTSPNIHLCGVALRLRARHSRSTMEALPTIEADLKASEELLLQSGDPLQLAETRLEVARLYLSREELEKARLLAQQARRGLSGDLDEFYPDDLRFLLAAEPDSLVMHTATDAPQPLRLMDILESHFPSPDFDQVLKRLISATNRMFRAERGGIFLQDESRAGVLNLKASCNLTVRDTKDRSFKPYRQLIRQSLQAKKPRVVSLKDKKILPDRPRAILCIPFKIKDKLCGALYHDNSYFQECFDPLDKGQLEHLSTHLGRMLGNFWDFSQVYEDRNRLVLEKAMAMGQQKPTDFLAVAPNTRAVLAQADKVAVTDASVLILGETGVGKEMLAHHIHEHSERRDEPFVVIDCGTIPEGLAESELFGHEKGAFTGADKLKQGRLELAHKGTLFIDEIGEISPDLQLKLLRILQEKTFTRIGGNRTMYSDFRLIAATNRDLETEIKAGRFRQDLYYRINVISMVVPPLRERPADVALLADYFVSFYARRNNKLVPKITSEDLDRLKAYGWPGNVRELKNIMERAVILSSEGSLDLDFPLGQQAVPMGRFADHPTLNELQRSYIEYVLTRTNGRISGPAGAAEWLGINRGTLYARMKKLGLPR